MIIIIKIIIIMLKKNIKSSLKNFAQEKKERENIFNQEENPFDNINEMLKQFKQKKKDEESNN